MVKFRCPFFAFENSRSLTAFLVAAKVASGLFGSVDTTKTRGDFIMILRKLNLAPRSALCFGFFCLMIIALGLIALKQSASLNASEKFVETNVAPSISLLGMIDREFISIKGSNSRLRNPIETENSKTLALGDVRNARARVQKLLSKLEPLIVTPMGKQFFGELSQSD